MDIIELTHSMAECDVEHYCWCGFPLERVIGSVDVYFFGPGFSSTDHVARPNVGRNPNNQNRYSK